MQQFIWHNAKINLFYTGIDEEIGLNKLKDEN